MYNERNSQIFWHKIIRDVRVNQSILISYKCVQKTLKKLQHKKCHYEWTMNAIDMPLKSTDKSMKFRN